MKGADVNDNSVVDIADAIYLLGYLLVRAPAPLAPFTSCAKDSTPDTLTCISFKRCE